MAVIGGDGIGPEVVRGLRRTAAGPDRRSSDLGAAHYLRTGEVLPDATLEKLRSFDAILLGAVGPPVGSTEAPSGLSQPGPPPRCASARRYANLALVGLPGAPAPDCDFVVVRENTEGTYDGEAASSAGTRPTRWPPKAR